MDYEKEIPFGAFDSELMHQEINIPEGFEATIEGNKIILTKTESEDEKIRKELIEHIKANKETGFVLFKKFSPDDIIAWLEKQGQCQVKESAISQHEDKTCKENNDSLTSKDDMMIEETLYFLREYQQSNRCNDENGMQNSVSCEKWLKSLKERINGKQ